VSFGSVAARLAVLAVSLATVACTTSTPATRILEPRHDASHRPTYAGLALASGQIVLSESPDATSFVFMLIPERFHVFTHAGVLSMEGGEPFVYEISGSVSALPLHARLLDNVTGEMHRIPLLEYVSRNLFAEVYDPPEGVDGAKVAAFARDAFKRGVKFDTYFRFDDHETYFCTELVELALRAGGARPNALERVNPNPSLALGIRWLDVTPDEALPAALFLDPRRYVGALSRFSSRTAAYAYFEAKREIYRRFRHKNQRLGFLFDLGSSGQLSVRPAVLEFAFGCSHLFDDVADPPPPGDERIARAVRRFADATFGPAPDDGP
jgi:hypothetical protein